MGKHLCWSLLKINLQSWGPSTLLKRDSNAGASNAKFLEHLFWRTFANDCEFANLKNICEFFAKTAKDLLLPQKTSTIDIWQGSKYRSSRQRCFVKKVFVQISEKAQKNTCIRVSYRRHSGRGVFLWILRNLSEHLFYRKSPVSASVNTPLNC